MKKLTNIINTLKENKSFHDLILIFIIMMITFIINIQLDLGEKIYYFSKSYEVYEVDELIWSLIIASFCFLYFSLQRLKEIKLLNNKLHSMSFRDELTNLNNRRSFYKIAEKHFKTAKVNATPIAVIFIDLDRFKMINNTLGHHIGDLLLQAVAKRLQSSMRKQDILCRLGGDEFLILLPDTNKEFAEKIAIHISNAFSASLIVEKYQLSITPSIGISLYPFDGENIETLIQNADIAMYQSKKHPGLKYQFYSYDINNNFSQTKILEGDLRKAYEQEEFEIHYQPQMNIKTRKIDGVEALLRWNHPEKGMISPETFIPLAEETGLIFPIGEWILRSACKQNKIWQEAGYASISVAVNVSIHQLQGYGFADTVSQILTETGLKPQHLVLEFTESMALCRNNYILSTLRQLKSLGVQMAIDDFGTGYSSLNYLTYFPINLLKLDRSFVQNIAFDPKYKVIISTIIMMAHNLNLNVIVEGVEEKEQLDFLNDLHCDIVQGYLIKKPIPAAKMENILSHKEYLFR